MSGEKRTIINCGASRVTAATVVLEKGNLQIERLVTEDLQYDFSKDEGWMDALGGALQSLSRNHGFGGRAGFILPGNQLLTKTIRIPHVEKGKQAQIIAYEAQQNIPYPLHEVVWDSHVVSDDGVEVEVLFTACKTNNVDGFCGYLSNSGFTPEIISAGTVLDYNTLQFTYPEEEDEVLVINVGARSTNLLFCNPESFFVRNIALGGNTLTQNIADNIGKSFRQAEELKIKLFEGEREISGEDSGGKLLQSAVDSFTRRMSQEITRSIVNYRRQKGGAAPKRILLNGRGALLEGLPDKLAESQKMEVELFDPLRNVTLDGTIETDPQILRLQISEIIGEAVREHVPNGAGVNLLPEEIQKSIRFASKKPYLAIAAACLAVAPWPAYFALTGLSAAYGERAEAIKEKIPPFQERQETIRENAETAESLGDKIEMVEGLVQSKDNWIQFFAELQKSLQAAEDVWLDNLRVIREDGEDGEDGETSYEVEVGGQMLVRETAESDATINQGVLARRIRRLQSSFEESEFVTDSRSPIITWTSLREGFNVLPFRIRLIIDPAKPL